jgi:hypothetical protein
MSGPLCSKIPVTMLIIAMHVNVLHCHLKALCCLLCMKPLIVILGICTFTGNRRFVLCSNDFTCHTVCKSLHPENLKLLNSFFLWACVIALVCVRAHTCANQWEYLSHLNYSGTVGMIAWKPRLKEERCEFVTCSATMDCTLKTIIKISR